MIYKELRRVSTERLHLKHKKHKSLYIHKDGTKTYSQNYTHERHIAIPTRFDLPLGIADTKDMHSADVIHSVVVKNFEMIGFRYDMIIYKEI